MKTNTAHHVAICVYDGLSMLEYGAAVEIFASHGRDRGDWYQTQVIGTDHNRIRLSGGGWLEVDNMIGSLADFDTILMPGWRHIDAKVPEPLIQALKQANEAGKRLVSFCSGAFVLAAAGVLDGKCATTHWKYAEAFARRFPAVKLQINRLYVQDGNVHTSAGSAACLDLSIQLIREDFGLEQANRTARRLVVPGHRDGDQQQFIELPVPKRRGELSKTLEWAMQNLAAGLTVERLAQQSHMSRRTFDRKFKQSFGLSAKQWLLNAQLEQARYWLESSDLPVELVAQQCGFATALSLRLHFEKNLGLTPSRYRKQFNLLACHA